MVSVIKRIKRAAPVAPLYVWCNEDTPLICEDLIRLQSGAAADAPLKGQFDVVSRIISPEGSALLHAASLPDDRIARHEFIADLLDAHSLPDIIKEQINLPELSAELITAMSQSY